jgi:hypothetical protein
MCLQLFVNKKYRKDYPEFLTSLQIYLLFVIPGILITIQTLLLIFIGSFKSSIYYFWTIADIIMNFSSIVSFLFLMQNFTNDHMQNMVNNEQLELEHLAETDNKKHLEYHERLELDKDYYAIAFCTFISYYKNKFQITHSERNNYVVNIIIIFSFQSYLLFSLLYFMKV